MPVIPALGVVATYALYAGTAASLIGAGVGALGSMAGAQAQQQAYQQQAAMQQQQAIQAQQIAAYNATMQRQNAEVAYQMAVYQSQANQNIAQVNIAMATQNAAFAEVQAYGSRQAYEQGLLNAEQQKIEAEAARAQGREEVNRKRQENLSKMALIRAKYGASGVTPEGSPLEVLSEAASLAETAVQDVAYTAELSSRKQYREAEIKRFEASFHLIDEMGHKVEASNARNEAIKFGYESKLYEYDSAIAGAKYRIGLNEARLTELSGAAEAWGFKEQAKQSQYQGQAAMTAGMFGAASSIIGGIGSAASSFSSFGGMAKTGASAMSYNRGLTSGSTGAAYSPGAFRWG